MFGSLTLDGNSCCLSDGEYSMNGWISLLIADGNDSPVPNEVGT